MSARITATYLAILSAIVYNSWPLGYLLNPAVARIGLASDLQATDQPYNWLFISTDVACGLLLILAAYLLSRGRQLPNRQRYALAGLLAFGTLTAISALLPLHCQDNIATCGYRPGQTLGWHDITGAIAAIGLFAAMLVVWKTDSHGRHGRWLGVILLLWSVWGAAFLLTPLPAVQKLPDVRQIAITWQQIFIILTGLGLVFTLYNLEKTYQPLRPPARKLT